MLFPMLRYPNLRHLTVPLPRRRRRRRRKRKPCPCLLLRNWLPAPPPPPPSDTVIVSTYFTPLFLILLSGSLKAVAYSSWEEGFGAKFNQGVFFLSIREYYRGPVFLVVIWFGSHTSPIRKLSLFSVFLCVAGRVFWRERGLWGCWGGAKLFGPEKGCSSINHLVLSAFNPLLQPPPPRPQS